MAKNKKSKSGKYLDLNPTICIVCEGSETENFYFEGMRRYLKSIGKLRVNLLILPVIIPKPQFRDQDVEDLSLDDCTSETFKYTELDDEIDECDRATGKLISSKKHNYQQYKSQPMNYVRKAHLCVHNNLCDKSWAVYDQDFHPAHYQALQYVQGLDNVKIAFSSYSIEEWFLLHFERCMIPFHHSDCKGTPCNCNDCIGGYIRNKNYIPNYSKNDAGHYFEDYTYNNLYRAYVNAAWSRDLASMQGKENLLQFQKNPFCSVDKLVREILDSSEEKERIIHWTIADKEFNVSRETLKVVSSNPPYLEYLDKRIMKFDDDEVYWVNESQNYQKVGNALNEPVQLKSTSKSVPLLPPPSTDAILCIKKGSLEWYIDMDIDKYKTDSNQ